MAEQEAAIPFMVIFGDDELKAGSVKVKALGAQTEELVPRTELVDVLRTKMRVLGL